jgi:hypothetical protein
MKHLRTYEKYLILESVSEGSDLLNELTKVVDQVVNSSMDAKAATEMIKSFTDENKEEIIKNITDTSFTKAMLTILSKWSGKYGEELDASRFDYVTSGEDIGGEDELEEYLPSDIDETPDDIEFEDEEDLGDLF